MNNFRNDSGRMPQSPPTVPRPGFPPSPCNRVCTLDDDNVCLGCRRTLREIVGWAGMTAAQQWTVVRDLPRRGQ